MHILLSSLIPEFMINQLCEHFPSLKTVLLPPYERLSHQVSSHPDMLTFFDLKTNSLFLFEEYYKQNRVLFDSLAVNIIPCKLTPQSDYPHDIALDALELHSFKGASTLICNRNFTANEIIKRFTASEYSDIINVKQGYTRCSTLVFGNSSDGYESKTKSGFDANNANNYAITSDRGISSALNSIGVNVLEISSGGIALPGFNCGFIGGASTVISDTAVFFGDITAHQDGEKIENFLHIAGCKTISLCRDTSERDSFPLTDFGGGVVIS